MSVEPTRVLLISKYHLMRRGLRNLIEQAAQVTVIDDVDVEMAVDTATREQPDVIILDAEEKDDLVLIPQLVESAPRSRLLVLISRGQFDLDYEAVQLGVHGVVRKSDDPALLRKSIVKLHEGETWFSRSLMARVLTAMQKPPSPPSPEEVKIDTLTERELEVINLLGQGLKNREIAEALHLSESTVRHHLTSIYSKLDVSDRLELLIFAYRYGLVEKP